MTLVTVEPFEHYLKLTEPSEQRASGNDFFFDFYGRRGNDFFFGFYFYGRRDDLTINAAIGKSTSEGKRLTSGK